MLRYLVVTLFSTLFLDATLAGAAAAPPTPDTRLDAAKQAFYNARYEEAAEFALSVRHAAPDDLAGYETRTAALLFEVKRLVNQMPDRRKGLASCKPCPALLEAFSADVDHGRALARARLAADPGDLDALFHLGKLNLNFVWLQLGPLGRRTGWREYWEARRALDALLVREPKHVRGRVARAWIDYIVDTKMPRGTRWLLGGGNRKGALAKVRDAAQADADFFTRAEAGFALWEMELRERDVAAALAVATRLARDFPENPQLTAFVAEPAASLRAKRD